MNGAAAPAAGASQGLRVLTFTTLFPNPAQRRRGLFVRHRVAAVARYCPTRVVAPVLRRGFFSVSKQVVDAYESHGAVVTHPAYTTLPKVARCADGALLYAQVLPHVRRLRAEFPFDLVDAHYAFPDGAAAVLLGRHFGVPVAITVRGGDLDMLPRYRLRRRAIVRTLRSADRVFAVSQHLAARAAQLGAPERRIRVVANGVDTATFHYAAGDADRRALGIPREDRLVVCAGNLLAEKGQHLLVEALDRSDSARVRAVLIGSDPGASGSYRRRLERLIAQRGCGERIRLLGSVDQSELAGWYRAADLLVLPTFREGSSNVVREALACGTPVVASRVGGIPELVTSEELGLLVEPGDADALARALGEALRREWNRSRIATLAAARDWQEVGAEVARELGALVPSRARR